MNTDPTTVRSSPLCKPNPPCKPRSEDAVLGDQVSATQGSLVLGGIDRLRQQLSASQQPVRLRAMQVALDRGASG